MKEVNKVVKTTKNKKVEAESNTDIDKLKSELELVKAELELERARIEASRLKAEQDKAKAEAEKLIKEQEEEAERLKIEQESTETVSKKEQFYKDMVIEPLVKDIPKSKKITEVYGFEIKEDTLYEVQEKFDASAPSGYQDYSTSKSLTYDIKDSYPAAIWDANRGNWDTGLYSGSLALREAFPGVDLEPIIANLHERIVVPYEKEIGEGKLNHVSNPISDEFWRTYRISVGRGTIFNTADPKQLFELYILVLNKMLTPKDFENDASFLNSQFIVVNKDSAISRKAETQEEIYKASSLFYTLLTTDRDNLLTVLEYVGLPVGRQTSKETLLAMFDNWLNDKKDKYQNYKIFNDTIENFSTKKGREILSYYRQLKELKAKGLVVDRKGEIFLDNTFVETGGLKNAAEKIYNDRELRELLLSL